MQNIYRVQFYMEENKPKVRGRLFEKGNTYGANKKGGKHQVTKFSREVLSMALAGQEVNIRVALEKLFEKNPEAYINAVAKLLNYAIPKLQATEIKGNTLKKIEISLDDNISIDELKQKMEALQNDAEDTDYIEVNE